MNNFIFFSKNIKLFIKLKLIMFDLTREIKLENVWQKRYRLVQFSVYFIFILISFCLVYLVLFPSKTFVFFFETPLASKNTVIEPRDYQNKSYKNGKIENGELIFDTALASTDGSFSKIKVSLILEKDSAPIEKSGGVSARKSYRSFFYPDGSPAAAGMSQNSAEFRSGSLLSNGDSVYIIDGDAARPIDNEITFQSMGFNWDDVTRVSSEQISAYRKGKLFTVASPHPSGTVFSGQASGKYYLIDDSAKHEIAGSEIIASYLSQNPIIVSEKSLEIENGCDLKKDLSIFDNSYGCFFSIENMNELLGNDYQYKINLNSGVKIKEAQVTFGKSPNTKNWKLTLSNIKKNIILNYYGQP